MELDELFRELNRISKVKIIEDKTIEIGLLKYPIPNSSELIKPQIQINDIIDFVSDGEMIRLTLKEDEILYVMDRGFMINVKQNQFYAVDNLPEMVTVSEIIILALIKFPKLIEEFQGDYQAVMGNFLYVEILIENAISKGFKFENILSSLYDTMWNNEPTKEVLEVLATNLINRKSTNWDFRVMKGRLEFVNLDDFTISYWNNNIKITPKQFYNSLTLGLTGFKVSFWIYERGKGGLILFKDSGEDNLNIFFLELNFDFENKSSEIIEIKVHENLQQRGLSKIVFKNLYSLFTFFGIHKIHIETKELGGYIGAKMGFIPNKKDWLKMREEMRIKVKSIKLEDDKMEKVLEILESDDPKSIWKIVDLDWPIELD